MKRKIVALISFVVLAALAGGFFYFWQNQKDVRALNKTLPKGVFITKSLWGNEYKVVNKIDNYEFKVPKAWTGIEKIEYIPETSDEKYPVTSINLKGLKGGSRLVAVDKFTTEQNPEINDWAQKIFDEYGFSGKFTAGKINNIDIVKTQENVHLGGMYVYFFSKNSAIYVITNASEESIKEIILNGKW